MDKINVYDKIMIEN